MPHYICLGIIEVQVMRGEAIEERCRFRCRLDRKSDDGRLSSPAFQKGG